MPVSFFVTVKVWIISSARCFIETSFEICNKVGGIYTVISTKARLMQQEYGDDYLTIGFYSPDNAATELRPAQPGKIFQRIFDRLASQGIVCHYGRWQVPGRPRCILIELKDFGMLDSIKAWLWERYGIDSLEADSWFDEPVAWSYAAGLLIEMLKDEDRSIVAQFHEWMAGIGLLYLKDRCPEIPTVFTVHATMLGRSLAGSGHDICSMVRQGLKEKETISVKKAYECHVQAKHMTETACAKQCDIFTTVSRNTADEAEYMLGRRPDIILPNGLDMNAYPCLDTLPIRKSESRKDLDRFLYAYFSPYYRIHPEKSLVMLTSGRYEFRNKGLDIFIESLGRLNSGLKEKEGSRDIFVIFAIPADAGGPRKDILESMEEHSRIEDRIDSFLPSIKSGLMRSVGDSDSLSASIRDLIGEHESAAIEMSARSFTSRRGQAAPACAFDLNYPGDHDSILEAFRRNGLDNTENQKVKVIFYPKYLSSSDSLLSMDYLSVLEACDIAVFPSYYEPWGYTPLESAAEGCISVTSDMAGFGRYISKKHSYRKDGGIIVLGRSDHPWQESVSSLSVALEDLAALPCDRLFELKMHAKKLSYEASWDLLSRNYLKAHRMALESKMQ